MVSIDTWLGTAGVFHDDCNFVGGQKGSRRIFIAVSYRCFLSEKEEEGFFGNAARRSELRVEGKKFNALKNKRARRFNGSRSILL